MKYVRNVLEAMRVSVVAKDYLGNFNDIDFVVENAGKYFLDSRPGNLLGAEIIPDNPLSGAETDWSISFQTSTPLPARAQITLTFPSNFIVGFERSLSRCVQIGLNPKPACVKNLNILKIEDATQSNYNLPSFVSIKVKGLVNPNVDFTSGFSLTTNTKEGYLVDNYFSGKRHF